MIDLYRKRYNELLEQLAPFGIGTLFFGNKKSEITSDEPESFFVINWSTKAKNLIAKSCGEHSYHLKEFEKSQNKPSNFRGPAIKLIELCAIFLAAKEDFEGGYAKPVRELIEAEIFGDELTQSQELLDSGYTNASAVIAGTVLETNLRSKCIELGIPVGKLDRMNADLVKKGAYNSITSKRIVALAAIRNSAAHGSKNEFEKEDVATMIFEIRRFINSNQINDLLPSVPS